MATSGRKRGRSPTAFERRVYDACSAIPRGSVSTYGALAAQLASSARAVGQALRRNPYAPRVPCHRVVCADRRLGGFSGAWGDASPEVRRKRALLESEGVALEDGARALCGALLLSPQLQLVLDPEPPGPVPALAPPWDAECDTLESAMAAEGVTIACDAGD